MKLKSEKKKKKIFIVDRRKRIEYLVVTQCVLITGFVIYGFVGGMGPLIDNNALKSFLFFGCLGGFGFSMLVSTLILATRFFSNRKLGFKIVAACLWPITAGCVVYVGVLCYFPYQVYNVVKILTEKQQQQ